LGGFNFLGKQEAGGRRQEAEGRISQNIEEQKNQRINFSSPTPHTLHPTPFFLTNLKLPVDAENDII
jgi:hypothetical protein